MFPANRIKNYNDLTIYKLHCKISAYFAQFSNAKIKNTPLQRVNHSFTKRALGRISRSLGTIISGISRFYKSLLCDFNLHWIFHYAADRKVERCDSGEVSMHNLGVNVTIVRGKAWFKIMATKPRYKWNRLHWILFLVGAQNVINVADLNLSVIYQNY